MNDHNIVFLDRDSVIANVRRPAFSHSWTEYAATAAADAAGRLAGATIAITNKVPLRADTLAQLPDLKMIAVAATGTDIIDLAACKERGIVVSNIRNYAYATLPEHTFSMILALRRNLLAYRADVQAGKWQKSDKFCLFDYPITDLAGSKLGLLGYGALGQAVARLGRAFGMEILVHKRTPVHEEGVKNVSWDELLESSDVLSLHAPLNDQTRNIIGASELARMKRSALLINTARGGLVDEAALARALTTGVIAGAGFDVLVKEPPPEDNVLLKLHLPNFILTPHIAWASTQAMQILADQLIDNIEAFAANKPVNVVG
jgi:glycerate dehydrogenase